MAAVAQTNEPRNPDLPLWIFVKLEGEDIDRDGFIWVANEGSERTVKCYSKHLKGPVMKYTSEGAKMALLEIYWNKIVSLTQGQQIIIKDQELNRLWADNHTKKMLGLTITPLGQMEKCSRNQGSTLCSRQRLGTRR